jgi:hypothetical protein
MSGTKAVSSSYIVWLGCVLYLALVKVILDTFLPDAFADPAQANFFGWAPLGVFSVVGLIGVWLSTKTGFPDAWDVRISNRQRLLLPILAGLVLGILLVLIDLPTGYTRLVAARHGVVQQYTNLPFRLARIVCALREVILHQPLRLLCRRRAWGRRNHQLPLLASQAALPL